MRMIKCTFEKDTKGFYIFPMFCVGKMKGVNYIWFGWLYWLFSIKLNKKS